MINRVLFYNSGGGIGDAIQILPLMHTLKIELKNSEFYYLSAHSNHFNSTLKDLNSEINTLDLDIKYFGFRWWHSFIVKNKIKKFNITSFDLIIDLQSKVRNSLILKMIPHKYFISPCLSFKLSKPKILIKKEKKINDSIIVAINYAFNTNYKLKDYDLSKIDEKFLIESKRLLPKNNYVGFSITQGNVYRKKEWAMNSVVEVCTKLIDNNKIPVFFIEKKNKNLINKIKIMIPEALFPENESNFDSPALVAYLAKRLDFAISIDNGIMHMLSLSKVPMIVLFGPTDSEKFLPDYKGCVSLDSKKIYNTKNISLITAEDVLKAAKQYLNFSY
jgi:ADP-heptose:LPS heptosyltransferase